MKNTNAAKTSLIVSIELIIAALHIIGPMRNTRGPWHDLYYSYFSDLALPFGFYFLLCASETHIPHLRPWWVKSALVFGAAATAEILQFYGIDALGITFDPLDIVMYALGVLLAAMLERLIFARRFSFWSQ